MHKFHTPGKAFHFDQFLADLLGDIGKVGNCCDHPNSLRASRGVETEQKSQANPDNTQIVLEYGADKSIQVNHQPIPLDQLESRLRDVFETRKEKTMFIVGDPSLRYGEIVAVIDAAKGAGVEKVGIVTMGMRNEAAGTAPPAKTGG